MKHPNEYITKPRAGIINRLALWHVFAVIV